LRVIDALLAQGAKLQIHDPEALQTLAARYPGNQQIQLMTHNYDACQGANGLLVLTAWPEYASPDFNRIASLLENPLIIDGRNLYDPNRVQSAGITYYCMGRSCLTNV
jgi:UDPglucose 6-dehydrogenase